MLAVRRPDVPLIVVRRALDMGPDTPEKLKLLYQWHATLMLRHLFPGVSFVNPGDFAARVVKQPTNNCIGEPTATLIHRSAFDRFGLFNPNFKVLTDWEFHARIAVHQGLCYVDDELATFRVHSKSTTQTELARSSFRTVELDALIMLHELAYSATFEPVREAARRRHALDLSFYLAREVRRTHRKAKRSAGTRGQPGSEALAELAALIRTYPRLAKTPRGYLRAIASEFLRHARWDLMRRTESLLSMFSRMIRAGRAGCL